MIKIIGALAGTCALFLLVAKWCSSDLAPAARLGEAHVFQNLSWGDTLVLSAWFSECGEWGGHREQILIYLRSDKRPEAGRSFVKWRQSPFTATWLFDSVRCPGPSRKYILKGQRLIDVDDERLIARYLQELQASSFKAIQPANSGNIYLAALTDGTLQLEFHNTGYRWDGYTALRDQLFN
ncbi:hypothetical protein GCM10027048_18400 [Hymenobacter coalescens]